jgi:hypothetical protein
VSFRPSSWNNSAPTERVFIKFDIEYFSKLEKIELSLKSDNITDALYEDVCTLLVIPRGIPRRMGNVSDESYRENQIYVYTLYAVTFFPRK